MPVQPVDDSAADALIDSLPVLVAGADEQGRIALFNSACERITGLRKQDVIGSPFLETLVPAQWHAVLQNRFTVASPDELADPHVNPWHTRGGATQDIEWRCYHAGSNGRRWIVGVGSPVGASDENRAVREFLAMIAHELRQPLTACVAALQVMQVRRSREEGHRARGVLERQLQQLSRLVEDLSDASRIMRGDMVLRRQRLDLRDVIEGAAETIRPYIEERRHRLELIVPEEAVLLEADGARLQQVFGNLLSNASRYSDPGARITVDLRRNGTMAVVSVRDTGQGIDPNEQPYVFDLFHRGSTEPGGLGVGLAIVRKLVALHGGSVTIRSEGLGHGSTFTVNLPML